MTPEERLREGLAELPGPYGVVPPQVELTANAIGKDLLSAMVDELKVLQDPWTKTSEQNQQYVIGRLRLRIEHLVGQAITMLAERGVASVRAGVDQVVFKDGCKVVLKVARGVEGVHDLADLVGQDVIVVMTDNPAEFLQNMGTVRAEPDQRALNITDTGDESDEEEPADEDLETQGT